MLLYDKDDNNDDIDDNNDDNAMVLVRNPLRMREPGPSTSLSEYQPSHDDDDDDCHNDDHDCHNDDHDDDADDHDVILILWWW